MIKGLPLRLKELRESRGYSQRFVAKRLGLSPSVISGYETGERTPSAENILSLAYFFGCSTDFILGKTNDVSPSLINFEDLTPKQIMAIVNLIDAMKQE